MKRNLWTATLLCVCCALVSGCETLGIAPSEQACEVVYVDILQDSTETLRQNAANNLTLEKLK